MLNITMPNVGNNPFMLNVIMLSVVAPLKRLEKIKIKIKKSLFVGKTTKYSSVFLHGTFTEREGLVRLTSSY
jgi:hypothetical protein